MSENKYYFSKCIEEHIYAVNEIFSLDEVVSRSMDLLSKTLKEGGKIMFCGNGGSAADSQHLAAEFVGRFTEDRIPLAAIALSTDTSVLTCIGNDYSFDEIFSRQVRAIGRQNDCLVAISTSGNSVNVANAVLAATSMGMPSIGLLGRTGGRLRQLCDISIVVPSEITARIQEVHILIGHILCGGVERQVGSVSGF